MLWLYNLYSHAVSLIIYIFWVTLGEKGSFKVTQEHVWLPVGIYNYLFIVFILFFPVDIVNEKLLLAISINKGYCSHQAITLQPSLMIHPEETQDEKTQDTALDSWGACQRNDFSEPRLFHLLIRRKMPDSLTWDIRFSLINSKLLMFCPPDLCCKNSDISWFLPYFFGAVPQSYLRGWVLGFSPQFCLPNKT